MIRLSTLTRQIALAVLALAGSVALPQAGGSRYTVEIVVFRNSGQAGALPGGTATGDADDGVEMTASTSRKLSEAARKLRAGGVRVLAHTAWIQSPVGCVGAACRNAVRGVSAVQLGIDRAGITGKVGLQRGTSLFLGVDLTIDDGGRRYRIQEARQIKADQPQYFDHPAIGVLAVITAEK